MPLERYENLTGTARALVADRWTRDHECLAGACIELSVCLELFEADLSEEPAWYQRRYDGASPRRRFKMFISAMKLPDVVDSSESELAGLSLDELELVWLAVHLDYMTAGDEEHQGTSLSPWTAVSVRNVQMVVMHLLTRSVGSIAA